MDLGGGRSINTSDVGVRLGRRGEVEVGAVNLFPIMPPVSGSPEEFVAASCMFMARHCGRRARGPVGGGGGGVGSRTASPGGRPGSWPALCCLSSSLGAEMMEWLWPTTLSQHSFNKSTCD